MDRRVVITGLGAVTPCGNSPEELWNSLMAGRHGFELAPWFPDQEPDNLSVVSRVKNFDASEYFDKKELRRNDVIVQYAVYCAMQALKDAGTDLKDIDPYRVAESAVSTPLRKKWRTTTTRATSAWEFSPSPR